MMEDIVDFSWIKTLAAQDYLNSLLNHDKRKHFGLLERPSLSPNKTQSTVKYKVFLCGKAGVGKSTLIARLAGVKTDESGTESAGIATTILHWPIRLVATGQVIFFQLHFWDVEENSLKKFNHILPACKTDVDCIMYTFSLTDRASFLEISSLLNQAEDNKIPVQIIAATKTDLYAYSDISEKEISSLGESRNIPVFRLKSRLNNDLIGKECIYEVAPFLNSLCALLFQRDFLLTRTSTSIGNA